MVVASAVLEVAVAAVVAMAVAVVVAVVVAAVVVDVAVVVVVAAVGVVMVVVVVVAVIVTTVTVIGSLEKAQIPCEQDVYHVFAMTVGFFKILIWKHEFCHDVVSAAINYPRVPACVLLMIN